MSIFSLKCSPEPVSQSAHQSTSILRQASRSNEVAHEPSQDPRVASDFLQPIRECRMSAGNVNPNGHVLLASNLKHSAPWQSVKEFELARSSGFPQSGKGASGDRSIMGSHGHVTDAFGSQTICQTKKSFARACFISVQ